MAITDVAAVKFCNEQIRPAADTLAQAYYVLKVVLDEWYARNMGASVVNTADVVEDGSAADGRQQITGADATGIIVRISEIVTDFEAGSKAKLNTILKVSPNPKR